MWREVAAKTPIFSFLNVSAQGFDRGSAGNLNAVGFQVMDKARFAISDYDREAKRLEASHALSGDGIGHEDGGAVTGLAGRFCAGLEVFAREYIGDDEEETGICHVDSQH